MSWHSHFSFLPQRLTLSWHVRDLRILKILPPRRRRLEGMGNSAMNGVLLLELLIAVSNGDIIDGYFQSRLYLSQPFGTRQALVRLLSRTKSGQIQVRLPKEHRRRLRLQDRGTITASRFRPPFTPQRTFCGRSND